MIKLTDVADIIDYENGELSEEREIKFFQSLIDSGQAWTLQGHYGRTVSALIEAGLCTLGESGHRDYWGNYVPSKHEVKPGTKGSEDYVKQRRGAFNS